MQSYNEKELIQTTTGKIDELTKAMPEQATQHVIGRFPRVNDEFTLTQRVGMDRGLPS